MTTIQDRPSVVVGAPGTRRPWLMVGMAVIGLLIGLLGGWLFFGFDDVTTVDGEGITDRQAEMVEMIEDHMVAWQANDVDGVLSHHTDTGVFAALGIEYRVADGGLADYVRSSAGASRMELVGPTVVVDGNTVIAFHTYAGDTLTNVFDFTPGGEVLIARHEVSS